MTRTCNDNSSFSDNPAEPAITLGVKRCVPAIHASHVWVLARQSWMQPAQQISLGPQVLP